MSQISIFDFIENTEPIIKRVVPTKIEQPKEDPHTGVRCYYSRNCKGHYKQCGESSWVCTENPLHRLYIDHMGCIAFVNTFGTTYSPKKSFESFVEYQEEINWRKRY